MTTSLTAAVSIVGLALAFAPAAKATELIVLAGGALVGVLGELGPAFEKFSSHKLTIKFAATPDLIKAATSGEPFDVGVTPVDVFKNADARAKFASGPTIDIARVGFGVVVSRCAEARYQHARGPSRRCSGEIHRAAAGGAAGAYVEGRRASGRH